MVDAATALTSTPCLGHGHAIAAKHTRRAGAQAPRTRRTSRRRPPQICAARARQDRQLLLRSSAVSRLQAPRLASTPMLLHERSRSCGRALLVTEPARVTREAGPRAAAPTPHPCPGTPRGAQHTCGATAIVHTSTHLHQAIVSSRAVQGEGACGCPTRLCTAHSPSYSASFR